MNRAILMIEIEFQLITHSLLIDRSRSKINLSEKYFLAYYTQTLIKETNYDEEEYTI